MVEFKDITGALRHIISSGTRQLTISSEKRGTIEEIQISPNMSDNEITEAAGRIINALRQGGPGNNVRVIYKIGGEIIRSEISAATNELEGPLEYHSPEKVTGGRDYIDINDVRDKEYISDRKLVQSHDCLYVRGLKATVTTHIGHVTTTDVGNWPDTFKSMLFERLEKTIGRKGIDNAIKWVRATYPECRSVEQAKEMLFKLCLGFSVGMNGQTGKDGIPRARIGRDGRVDFSIFQGEEEVLIPIKNGQVDTATLQGFRLYFEELQPARAGTRDPYNTDFSGDNYGMSWFNVFNSAHQDEIAAQKAGVPYTEGAVSLSKEIHYYFVGRQEMSSAENPIRGSFTKDRITYEVNRFGMTKNGELILIGTGGGRTEMVKYPRERSVELLVNTGFYDRIFNWNGHNFSRIGDSLNTRYHIIRYPGLNLISEKDEPGFISLDAPENKMGRNYEKALELFEALVQDPQLLAMIVARKPEYAALIVGNSGPERTPAGGPNTFKSQYIPFVMSAVQYAYANRMIGSEVKIAGIKTEEVSGGNVGNFGRMTEDDITGIVNEMPDTVRLYQTYGTSPRQTGEISNDNKTIWSANIFSALRKLEYIDQTGKISPEFAKLTFEEFKERLASPEILIPIMDNYRSIGLIEQPDKSLRSSDGTNEAARTVYTNMMKQIGQSVYGNEAFMHGDNWWEK